MTDRFTNTARRALARSEIFAQQRHQASIEPAHLLLALLELPISVARDVLDACRVDRRELKREVVDALPEASEQRSSEPATFSVDVQRVLVVAGDSARVLGHAQVGTGHLLWALHDGVHVVDPRLSPSVIRFCLQARHESEEAAAAGHGPTATEAAADATWAALERASELAKGDGTGLEPRHLLSALMRDGGRVGEVLRDALAGSEFDVDGRS